MDISSKMQNVIEEQLKEIEEKENVKIIYCVESGSRAWGFASPDSDYDVRFIYVRNKEDYLKLNKNRDVIEWRLDDVLDINGWDIQKALRLLYKSNPTLFEWSMSPIVYKTTPQWEKISGIVSQYFLEKTGVYHYLSMAKGNYREYLKTDEVKLKKYFYVIRPILACKWILDKKTAPPMLFSELMNECLDDELKPEINRLLEIKKQTSELGKGKRIDVINDYIEKELAEIEKKADIITKKYGLEKDGYILFLARIVPEKGLHYLIDAFMQTDTDKKLVIAGGVSHSGEYAKQIHDMAKDDRIIFTGFVEGDELWGLYYNCRMYVLPSDVEGMPISLLEAMACGCECLVSDIDTAKNVVGEYGYTFKKSDVNDLKNKLCEILGKPKADKAEQIEYVKNNYSWDEITDRTLELYKK